MRIVAGVIVSLLAAGVAGSQEEREPEVDPVVIPLQGLKAGCCEGPVREAIAGLAHVASVKIQKSSGLYFAEVVLKPGYAIAVSDIAKALEAPNKGMGARMGTRYAVDPWLLLSAVHILKMKDEPDAGKLKQNLSKLAGYKSSWTSPIGFGVAFEGDKQPTADQLRSMFGGKVTDLVLAPARDGYRYYCPKHPEQAAAMALPCPVCKEDGSTVLEMIKVACSKGGPRPPESKKSGGGGG